MELKKTKRAGKWSAGLVRALVSLAVCVGVLGLSAGILAYVYASAGVEAVQEESGGAQLPRVEVQRIELTNVEDTLTLTGAAMPWEDVLVPAETAGIIEWLGVDKGSRVEEGQELARIDTESIRAAVDQAQAQAKLAAQEFDRVQSLRKRGVSADRDFDSAQANLDVARANLRSAEIQLRKSVVKAPFAGIVDRRMGEPKEFTDAGQPLFRLVQTERVKASVGVPERDIGHFEEGDAVRVAFDALPGATFDGTIHHIATTADMSTHTFTTEIEVDNEDGRIRPGMIARVTFVRASYPDSVLVPIFSTFLLDETRYAVVVEDGLAQLRTVEAGIIKGGTVQITEGLEPGDLLVTRGQYEVRGGEPVEVTNTSKDETEDGAAA